MANCTKNLRDFLALILGLHQVLMFHYDALHTTVEVSIGVTQTFYLQIPYDGVHSTVEVSG